MKPIPIIPRIKSPGEVAEAKRVAERYQQNLRNSKKVGQGKSRQSIDYKLVSDDYIRIAQEFND